VSDASASALRMGLERAHWTIADLWVASIGIGGGFSEADVRNITAGGHDATPTEHDILAAAINGYLSDRGRDPRVPYWVDL
jgi:hypothetical protein